MRRAYRSLRILVGFIFVLCFVGQSTSQSSLALSSSSRFKAFTYEAERAQIQRGKVAIKTHPNASGGAFAEAESKATLLFSVNAPQRMLVRVIPVFWRNSVREQPRFFPYPLPTLFGPDVVVALGNRFYFTAPASGQIGIVDASNGQIVGSVKVGGYLTDLVADEKRHRLLVADAWGGRIIAIDAKNLRSTAEAKVPQVWSLALTPDDRLVAVSRSERRLFVMDAETLKPLQEITLPVPPTQISAAPITVGFEPFVFRLPDFAPMPADRIDYGFGPRTTAEFGPRNQVGWKRFFATPQGLQLTVRTEKGDEQRLIPLPEGSKPFALAVSGNRLLVATDKGALVILDAPSETVTATLQITDRPFDVAVVAGKTYATDPTQNRVLLIDAAKGSVVKVISVPDEPVMLEVYEPRWWTQDDAPQPLLFVACRKAKAIAIIEVANDQIVRVVPLPFEPLSLRTVIPPNPDWWPLIPAHRIAIELTLRLAVLPTPIVFGDKGQGAGDRLHKGLKPDTNPAWR